MIVKLLEIVPVSVYEGKTYTQRILVEARNCDPFAIYDPHKRASSDLIGETVKIDVCFEYVDELQPNPDNETGIKVCSDWKGMAPRLINGKLVDIDEANDSVVVDVGVGTIELAVTTNQLSPFSDGDYISASKLSQSYLMSIENDNRQ